MKIRDIKRFWQRLRMLRLPPPALLSMLYLVAIAVGSLLLMLPMSHNGNVGISDAIFTSASAVTVTGLTVLDTGSEFTLFGQMVIAVLIQLVGLGLMTFAVLLLLALGIPIGMPQRVLLRENLNQSTTTSNLFVLSRLIIAIAIACEIVGTIALSFVFMPEFGFWAGLWQSLFHSISAFNNAGIQLFPNGLANWVGDPIVNITIPALFIVGGLGFIVVGDIYQKRAWKPLSLHSKLMLVGTGILIVFGSVGFGLLEWSNPDTLGALGHVQDKLWASWFQGVSPRTAGFNTVNIGGLHDSTSILMMGLMLVGGGSTSTAGGIKVTTLAVLTLATIAFFLRRKTLNAFGRSIGIDEVLKVMALVTISIMIIFTAIFLISISHDGEFMDLIFEVTSAFATVGLSRGETSELGEFGRAIIILAMFIGRVGPLAVGFFLATGSPPRVKYPKGEVYLG